VHNSRKATRPNAPKDEAEGARDDDDDDTLRHAALAARIVASLSAIVSFLFFRFAFLLKRSGADL